MEDFLWGYFEAALWCCGLDRSGLEFEPRSLSEMTKDCTNFYTAHEAFLVGREQEAGFGFWLSRNGINRGFRDAGIRPSLARLLNSEAAVYPPCTLMVVGRSIRVIY